MFRLLAHTYAPFSVALVPLARTIWPGFYLLATIAQLFCARAVQVDGEQMDPRGVPLGGAKVSKSWGLGHSTWLAACVDRFSGRSENCKARMQLTGQ